MLHINNYFKFDIKKHEKGTIRFVKMRKCHKGSNNFI